MDLRVQEAEIIFPEGLAGGSCGGLERSTSRGTPTALLRREAADALIMSLDGYGDAGTPGIKGTSSEEWRARHSRAKNDVDAEEGVGVGSGDAEAATVDAESAAETRAEAGAGGAGGGSEEGEEGEQTEKVLGSGQVWEEMKALAESRRKPLKGVRPVTVQPGQVRVRVRSGGQFIVDFCRSAVCAVCDTIWAILFRWSGQHFSLQTSSFDTSIKLVRHASPHELHYRQEHLYVANDSPDS